MAPKRSRAQYSKSTGGCRTCKIRHVKCDETLPKCQRCTSTGRKCDGPQPSQIILVQHQFLTQRPQHSPPRAPPDSTPWLVSLEERRAFAYYIDIAAPTLSGPSDTNLWSKLLPQLAVSDSIVRHAILAISHFIEHPVRYDVGDRIVVRPLTRQHVTGLRWQAQALSADKDHPHTRQITDIMLRCLLFPSLEFQQNNFLSGILFLRTAFKVLAPLLTAMSTNHSSTAIHNHPVVQTLMPRYMRNAALLFTVWTEFELALWNPKSLTELEEAVFLLLCIVYGVTKDLLLAMKSNTQGQMGSIGRKLEDLGTRSTIVVNNIQILAQQRLGNVEKLQSLRDYHTYLCSWLQVLQVNTTKYVNGAGTDFGDFMGIILNHCTSVLKDAQTLYPVAFQTVYFYDCIISPLAYLVAVLAPNGVVRNQALRLMNEEEIEPSNNQLHALILSQAGGDPFGFGGASQLRYFQIYFGTKDPESGQDRVYTITV